MMPWWCSTNTTGGISTTETHAIKSVWQTAQSPKNPVHIGLRDPERVRVLGLGVWTHIKANGWLLPNVKWISKVVFFQLTQFTWHPVCTIINNCGYINDIVMRCLLTIFLGVPVVCLHVFMAEESITQTVLRALPHVDHALYPVVGREFHTALVWLKFP